ncbi:MAG TPA: hypothetical protein VF765_24150 [Polyangiaceae bacterium]
MMTLDHPSTPSLTISTPDAVQATDFTRVRKTRLASPEPTALPKELRRPDATPELSRWVDRRADLLPVRRGPTWYTPRYGLSDAERVPARGRRR